MKKKLTNEVICFEQRNLSLPPMQYTQSVLKHTLIFPAGREKASTQNGMNFFLVEIL